MKRQLIYHTHVDTSHRNHIHVHVTGNNGNTECSLDRVSRDSATLKCNGSTLSELMPNKTCSSPKDPINLNISFKVPQKIEVTGRVIYARRLSKNDFLIEIKFTEISESSSAYLDNFIDASLNKDRPASVEQNQLDQRSIIGQGANESKNEITMNFSKVA